MVLFRSVTPQEYEPHEVFGNQPIDGLHSG